MSRSNSVRFGQVALTIGAGLGLAGVLVMLFGGGDAGDHKPTAITHVVHREAGGQTKPDTKELSKLLKVRPAPEFVEKGIDWIVKAQHPDGGWGAGSHAHQDIKDPHAVQVDPATTAFVASALLRSGSTPFDGEHHAAVRRATDYLCSTVEKYTKPGPKITDLEGTQIQAKLGPLVDTAMTAQYLARVLPTVPTGDALHGRVDKALDKCLAKLNESQQKDGSWNVGGGWASVLQSSLACSAFEFAQAAGKDINDATLEKARKYNLGNYDLKSGATKTGDSAGVSLYAFSSSMRANAAQAKAAYDAIDEAKEQGKLAADAPVSEENLKIAGVQPSSISGLLTANSQVAAQNLTINSGAIAPHDGTLSLVIAEPKGATPIAGTPALETVASSTPTPSGISKTGSGTLTLGAASTYSGGTVVSGGTLSGFGGRAGGGAGGAGGDLAATTEEALLTGFGNNGGEEFLSYMLAAESTVILGEKDWNNWYDKMAGRLSKVQNSDGSWSGHHCITSPVFCTAAVVQTMTADHDAEMLARLAKEAATLAKVDVKAEDKSDTKE